MYIVEGNIGVGKSTFLKLLHDFDPSIDIALEPQENWACQRYGQSLLDQFYKNPRRWAFTIETLAMIFRAREHVNAQKSSQKRRVFERSIYSGHYVFALNGRASGYFNEAEWQVYIQWFDFLLRGHCELPRGFIYLQATPEVCYKRVCERSRESEVSLGIDYMEHINHWHEKFLQEKKDLFDELAQVPVLTLNCNQDFVKEAGIMQEHANKVISFLEKTGSGKLPEISPRERVYKTRKSF